MLPLMNSRSKLSHTLLYILISFLIFKILWGKRTAQAVFENDLYICFGAIESALLMTLFSTIPWKCCVTALSCSSLLSFNQFKPPFI